MKNKNFFYQQYNKINWENQEKTEINKKIYNLIIKKFILKNKKESVNVFDIGFGIGFFIKVLCSKISNCKKIFLAGCEPSIKNYNYFRKNSFEVFRRGKFYKEDFLKFNISEKFDFITAIYVFPHFESNDLEEVIKKSYKMLNFGGKFILVVANEEYINKKLSSKRDLFIERNVIKLNGIKYGEILHYSEIPEIGKVIDYNREEKYYIDIFEKNKFKLSRKINFNDSGFVATIFIFEKK